MVCFSYRIVEILYTGNSKYDCVVDDDDDDDNNNVSRQMEQSIYWLAYWLQVKQSAVQFPE
jgi:hypothetical protein